MIRTRSGSERNQRGFSLIEMLVVLVVLTVISAGILTQMDLAQQLSYTEQIKLDDFQQARDFGDQFVRDISQAGYPNPRMMNITGGVWVPLFVPPYANDQRLAVGLVSIGGNEQ